MAGLCRLVEADAWVWTLACQIVPGASQVYAGYLHEGLGEDRFAKLLKAIEHPVMGEAVRPFYSAIADGLTHVTMRRDEIDARGLALQDGPRQLWEAADIGPLILSGYPLDENSLSIIGLYRRLDASRYTPRESRIVHLVLGEIPWLHMVGWPEDRGANVPSLYPQQRVVLNLLLDGMDRKQIAEHTALSENTVAGYARDIYRHFGVHSQTQLMRKFLGGAK